MGQDCQFGWWELMFSSMLMRLAMLKAAAGGESLQEHTATGNPATFDTDIAKALKSLSIPISSSGGISGLSIVQTGKNLFKTTATSKTTAGVTYTVNADGTVTVSGTATGYSDLMLGESPLPPSGKLMVSGLESMTNIVWDGVRLLDESKTVIATKGTGSRGNQSIDLSDYPDARYIRLTVKRASNVATSGTIEPQVEISTTATAFTEYEGKTKTVAFGETVEEGTLDATTGVLAVTAPAAKTITLDPVSIETIKGVNNIWTDTDGSNTVKYYSKS